MGSYPRRTVRLPGRYREDIIPPPPGIAKWVHPTIPFNPNLRPATFPTLDMQDTFEEMEARNRRDPELKPARKASVFRDKRVFLDSQVNLRDSPGSQSGFKRKEGENMNQMGEKAIKIESDESGEYDSFVTMPSYIGDGYETKSRLPGYGMRDEWARITPGLKIIIIMELTTSHTFMAAMEMLTLTEEEIEEVKCLLAKEIARLEQEESMITGSQARQLDMLMNESGATSSESFSRILNEDLYANLEDPASFTVKKVDLAYAKAYLASKNMKELADRLWRYEGVALSCEIFGFLGALLNRQESTIHTTSTKDLNHLATDNGEIVPEACKKRKYIRRKPLPKRAASPTSETSAPKRRGILRMKTSTGLRTSTSAGDQKETFDTSPSAVQPHVWGLTLFQAPPVPDQQTDFIVPRRPKINFVKKNQNHFKQNKNTAEESKSSSQENESRAEAAEPTEPAQE